eukprot:4195630-Ditylum_brightwellii.AAC.1
MADHGMYQSAQNREKGPHIFCYLLSKSYIVMISLSRLKAELVTAKEHRFDVDITALNKAPPQTHRQS